MATGKKIFHCEGGIEIIAAEQAFPGSWGRGKSPNEAVKKAVSEGAKRINGFTLYAVPEGTTMTGMGGFRYHEGDKVKHPLRIGTV